MRARKYQHIIEIWQTRSTTDEVGFDLPDTPVLIRRSWAHVETVSNNSRYSQRLTDLGITDPTSAIIVNFRHRNDTPYNAINMFLKYRGLEYVIQNYPTNINLQDVEIQIIATKRPTESVDELIPIT